MMKFFQRTRFLSFILLSVYDSVISGFSADGSEHSGDEAISMSLSPCSINSTCLSSHYLGSGCEFKFDPSSVQPRSCDLGQVCDKYCSVLWIELTANCSIVLSLSYCDLQVVLNVSEFECVSEDIHLFKGFYFDVHLNTSQEFLVTCSNFSQIEIPIYYNLFVVFTVKNGVLNHTTTGV